MKSALQAKLLQHFAKKKNQNGGFTLIELLVVIIIVGILAAIALPSFLNQAAKARGAEAKANVGAMNSAQQAYYVENSGFATSLGTLQAGIPASTENYTYATTGNLSTATTNAGKTDLKGYGGYVAATTTSGETIFDTILCESAAVGASKTSAPTSATSCGTDKEVK